MNRWYLILSVAALLAACDKGGDYNFNTEALSGRDLASLNVSDAKMIYQKMYPTKAAEGRDYWKVDLTGNESKLLIKGSEGEVYEDINIGTVAKLSDRILLVQVDPGSIHIFPNNESLLYLVDIPTEKMYKWPQEIEVDPVHGTVKSASDSQGNVYFAYGYDNQYHQVYKVVISDFTMREMLPAEISFTDFMVTSDGFIAYWSGYGGQSGCRVKCPGGRIYPLSDDPTFIFNGDLYSNRDNTIIRYETVGDNSLEEKEVCTIPSEENVYGSHVPNYVRKTVLIAGHYEFDGKECKELDKYIQVGDIRTSRAWYIWENNTFSKTNMQDYGESQFSVSDYEIQSVSAGSDSPNITFTGYRYSDGANVAGTISERDEIVIDNVAENGNRIINLIALN